VALGVAGRQPLPCFLHMACWASTCLIFPLQPCLHLRYYLGTIHNHLHLFSAWHNMISQPSLPPLSRSTSPPPFHPPPPGHLLSRRPCRSACSGRQQNLGSSSSSITNLAIPAGNNGQAAEPGAEAAAAAGAEAAPHPRHQTLAAVVGAAAAAAVAAVAGAAAGTAGMTARGGVQLGLAGSRRKRTTRAMPTGSSSSQSSSLSSRASLAGM